jgi:hypothetical protein
MADPDRRDAAALEEVLAELAAALKGKGPVK